MPNPVLVGYGPRTADGAPVRFGAGAARFTGALRIVNGLRRLLAAPAQATA